MIECQTDYSRQSPKHAKYSCSYEIDEAINMVKYGEYYVVYTDLWPQSQIIPSKSHPCNDEYPPLWSRSELQWISRAGLGATTPGKRDLKHPKIRWNVK